MPSSHTIPLVLWVSLLGPALVPGVVVAASAAPPPSPGSSPLPSPLSLADALRLFRERGFDLLLADAQAESAAGDVVAANAIPNPNGTGGLYHSFFRNGLYETHNGWFVGLGDSSAIEDTLSGKRRLRTRVAEAALAATKLQRADAQRNLEFQVKQQYEAILLAVAEHAFADEVATSTDATFQLNQARFRAGAISEVDLSKAETAKLEADQAVDTTQQAVRQAKIALGFLLGQRDGAADFEVAPSQLRYLVPPRLADASPADLTRQALQNRPDLQALLHQRQRAAEALALARRQRFPDVGIDLQYQQEGSATGTNGVAGVTPPTVQLSLTTTLPIFYQQQGEIRKASADQHTQDIQTEKVQAQIVADVQSAFNGFLTSRKLVERMEGRLLERARRARDLVVVQYQKGAASLLELLDAQRTFISTNLEYLEDLAGYWTAVYQLEQATALELSP